MPVQANQLPTPAYTVTYTTEHTMNKILTPLSVGSVGKTDKNSLLYLNFLFKTETAYHSSVYNIRLFPAVLHAYLFPRFLLHRAHKFHLHS